MKIAIDLQAAQTPSSRHRGIGRASLALVQSMVRNPRGHEIHLVLNEAFGDADVALRKALPELPPGRAHWFSAPPVPSMVSPYMTRVGELMRERFIRDLAPDLLHVTSLFEGLGDAARGSFKRVPGGPLTSATLYDLIPYLRPETYLTNPVVREWYFEKVNWLRQAHMLVAISDYARQEAIDALGLEPDRVVAISCGADPLFQPVDWLPGEREELGARYGLTRPYVMYTGGDDERKNLVGLIKGWAQVPAPLRDARHLLIVCRLTDARRATLQQIAAEHGLKPDDLVLPGAFVPDEDLRRLYAACDLFVFPSLHEGFGLPVLEAMCCGAPVLAGNNSSLPEVVGRADALFDPRTPEGIAEAIARALSDPGMLQSLREHAPEQAARFSWDISASRALDGFEFAHDRLRHLTAPPVTLPVRQRLAIVLNEDVAFDRARLLPPLAQQYDVTVVADEPAGDWSDASYVRQTPAWFDQHAEQFARVLYVPSADGLDETWLARMARRPSVLVLPSIWAGTPALRARGAAQGAIHPERLESDHGSYVLPQIQAIGPSATALRLPWTRDLFAYARRVVVTDPTVATQARTWFGDAFAAQLDVLPDADAASFLAALDATPRAPSGTRTLFVDVTKLASEDLHTGIERVVRSVLAALPGQLPPGWRLVPVRATDEGYISAARLSLQWTDFPLSVTGDGEPVQFAANDVFFGLDWAPGRVTEHRALFSSLRAQGVGVYFMVYDMLPVQLSDCFPDFVQDLYGAWLATVADVSTGLLTISRAVADDLSAWLATRPGSAGAAPSVGWFHLGADIDASVPTEGDAEPVQAQLDALSDVRKVLSVGTVEPRKGHAEALDAFEALWAAGRKVTWIIVGKQGWNVDALAERLRAHQETGRVIWLDQANDTALRAAYGSADLVLFPTRGEGFGLPMIEAAQHGVPVLARDLPVLREVAGEHAAFFPDGGLAEVLKGWLDGSRPIARSVTMPRHTWQASTQAMLGVLLDQRWAHRTPAD